MEDNNSFLEGIWNKIETGVKAVDFTDHVDYTDPLGWETLGQRWGEKTIGKKWREGQMQDVWNAVPKAWRPNITKAAMATAEGVGTAWQGARTVDNWFNPLDVAAAGTARSIELAALPVEGLAQLTSAGTGLDIELSRVVADFIPVGGIINRTKLLRRANIAKKVLSKSSFSPGSLDDLLEKAVKSGNKEEMKRVLDLMETQDIDFIRENVILSSIENKIEEGSGYSYREGRQLNNPIYDNLPPKVQKQFTDAGIDSDQATFFIENWTREVGATVEGFPFTDRTFEFMKSELLPQILEDLKGVDLSDGLQLDHIAQLRAMTPFYQGRNLKQAEKIRRILIKEGIFGGHNPKNLKYLPTDVHIVKTRFWEDLVGKDGSKFFKGRKMRTYADVQKAAKEMKKFINESNAIVETVSEQYKLMRGVNIDGDELYRILQKVDLNEGPYNLKDVRKLIDEISIDTKTLGGYTGQKTIFSQVISDNIDDLIKFTENNMKGEEALLDVLFEGLSPTTALKKYKKFDPTITQGTFNNYLKQAKQKDVMEQLKKLRRGKSIKLDEQTGMRPDD